MTNWRAMQAAGSRKMKQINDPHPEPPHGIKARYMNMGSWKQNLFRVKEAKRQGKD